MAAESEKLPVGSFVSTTARAWPVQGSRKWFTWHSSPRDELRGESAKCKLHVLRPTGGAVMAGAETGQQDPILNVVEEGDRPGSI